VLLSGFFLRQIWVPLSEDDGEREASFVNTIDGSAWVRWRKVSGVPPPIAWIRMQSLANQKVSDN
jgi:hypothetical protein